MNRIIFALALVAIVFAIMAPGVVYAGDMDAPKTVSCVERDPSPTVSPVMAHKGPKKKLKKRRHVKGHHGRVASSKGL